VSGYFVERQQYFSATRELCECVCICVYIYKFSMSCHLIFLTWEILHIKNHLKLRSKRKLLSVVAPKATVRNVGRPQLSCVLSISDNTQIISRIVHKHTDSSDRKGDCGF
jgi:hypothetical protein